MTNVDNLVKELMSETRWQQLPAPLTFDDYFDMIVRAIERMYTDTGRALTYNANGYTLTDEPTEDDPTAQVWYFEADFEIDEKEYILLCAQASFFKLVQGTVNNIIGYVTDAFSVTNADKPYLYLGQSISDLERRLRTLFHKMPRFGTVAK